MSSHCGSSAMPCIAVVRNAVCGRSPDCQSNNDVVILQTFEVKTRPFYSKIDMVCCSQWLLLQL